MAWHDVNPWRRKHQKRARPATVTERLALVERQCSAGDLSLHAAILEAYQIGIEAGRANPAIQRVGEAHSTEVET